MKNTFFFTSITCFYSGATTQALHCYKCGHLALDGVSERVSHRRIISLYPSFHESCESSKTPNISFLSFCGETLGSYSDAWCTKVFIEGYMDRVPVKVRNTLRDCVRFPTGWSQGCNNWTKTDLLNSPNIPLDFKNLASYFITNTTMQNCTCKGNGCDIEPRMDEPRQIMESFWRKFSNIGINHHHYAYSKRLAELAKNRFTAKPN